MNTKISYEYRDGSNYRRHGEWTVRGMCSQDQADRLRTACLQDDGRHFFVPSAVGIPSMTPDAAGWDDDLDHPMHSIVDIEMTGEIADDDRSVTDLIEAFSGRDWEADGAAATAAATA